MDDNEPRQEYVNRGWFKVSQFDFEDNKGRTRIGNKTEVYQKGLDGIRKIILKTRV